MAYSDNPLTLKRLLPQLQPLAEGSAEVTWRVPYGRAKWWAHRVREALRIARSLESAPAGLKRDLKVKVLSPVYVRALVKDGAAPELDLSTSLYDPTEERLRGNIERQVSVITANETDVSDSWLARIGSAWASTLMEGSNKLYLPDAKLSREELLRLWEWCKPEDLIFFENEGALTLMHRTGNEKAAAYAWTPEDL